MDMVEKVARAIFEAWAAEEGSDATWTEVQAMNDRDGYTNAKKFHRLAYAEARAAIEAMRTPTDAQLAAFHNSCDSNGQCLVKYGYTAMIDAALTGTNHPQ